MTLPVRNAAVDPNLALAITRTFDAPRSLVFKAWTQPEHMVRWCGPHGFTMTHCDMDMRVGGRYRCAMRSDEYGEIWWQGVCTEFAPPERLAFTFAWEEDGKPGHETLVSITLSERDGKTEMVFRQVPFESVESRDSHEGGWSEAFEKLAGYLDDTNRQAGTGS